MKIKLIKITALGSLRLLFLGLLSMLIAACSSDNKDLRQYFDEVRKSEPKPIDPIPKFQPLPKFLFPDEANRRNPFKPSEVAKKADQLAPDQHRKKQPLEAFPLDALKFVGNLKEGGLNWALIKQPDGKVNFVKVGDYMGKNFGRIIFIKNDLIRLEESLKDSGKWEKHITTINLYDGK